MSTENDMNSETVELQTNMFGAVNYPYCKLVL